MTTVETKAGDKIRRDFRGRPYIYRPDVNKEVTYTRTSTFSKALSDGDALSWWRMERLVEGLVADRSILNAVQASDSENRRQELAEVIARASELGGANDAATWGTTLHHFADIIDFTDEVLSKEMWELEPSLWDALDAYVELTKDITMLSGEEFVVEDSLMVAGSYDRTMLWKGRKVVADLKTGAIRFPDHGIQMACYSRSRHYNVETGQRVPGPLDDVDPAIGVIVHLPRPGVKDRNGKYVQPSLIPVDLDEGWRLAGLADEVRRARRTKLVPALEGK